MNRHDLHWAQGAGPLVTKTSGTQQPQYARAVEMAAGGGTGRRVHSPGLQSVIAAVGDDHGSPSYPTRRASDTLRSPLVWSPRRTAVRLAGRMRAVGAYSAAMAEVSASCQARSRDDIAGAA